MFDSRVETITEVIWKGEARVTFRTDKCCVWGGAKRKDFWCPEEDWESRLVPGVLLKYWTVQYSTVVGFQAFLDGEWVDVWCTANDFQTKAERDKGRDKYVNFIHNEGKNIAKWIDEGKTLKEIGDLVDDGHTGNTYGCALSIGIQEAKDKELAAEVRDQHNVKYGVTESEGVVNPAILTLKAKKEGDQ